MVTITNFAIWICLVVIPLVVMAIIGVTTYRYGFQDLLLYHGLVQLGTIISFLAYFMTPFMKAHEDSCQLRDGVLVLRERAKAKGLIKRTTTDIMNDVEPDFEDDNYQS